MESHVVELEKHYVIWHERPRQHSVVAGNKGAARTMLYLCSGWARMLGLFLYY